MNVCSLNERGGWVVMCRVVHFYVIKIMKLGRADAGIAGYRSGDF
jgi:hypothetical protein